MTGLPALEIPWVFTDAPGILMWNWVTDHFAGRITGKEAQDEEHPDLRNVRSYTWELFDLMRSNQGVPRQLVEGISHAFDDAELRIREHVGKCYHPSLGYRVFAGPLALTFTLASGETVDVSPLVGSRCSVTVLLPDQTERTVAGEFSVDRYRWRIATPDEYLEIVPEHVVRITNRSDAADRASALIRHNSYTGIGRMYREEPRAGCSGRPGFTLGTVDHAGSAPCPIHESGLSEHVLR